MLKVFLFAWVILSLLQLSPNVHSGSFMDKFIDPKDGKFDTSDWLLQHRGFLPVPIIVTEPAVGYGGGAALLFFHQSMDEKIAQQQIDTGETVNGKKKKLLPPSISGLFWCNHRKRNLVGWRFSFRQLERGPYPVYGRLGKGIGKHCLLRPKRKFSPAKRH